MHDTYKRMISKGAQFAHKYKLKIHDISADDEVASLDHLLQDNCIFQLIEKHYKAHLSPNYGAFYKNIGEAHNYFFSRHSNGRCSCRAIQLGCPSDSNASKKQHAKVNGQPAKVTGMQQRLAFADSSGDDDSEEPKEPK